MKEDAGDETARLEAALARIARARPPGRAAGAQPAADTRALAARLDALISDLRAVLGRDSAD